MLTLSIIIIPLKSDNNISLQLANFIPKFLDKEFFRKNKNYFQSNAINMKLYDGKIATKDKFGFKKVNYLLEKQSYILYNDFEKEMHGFSFFVFFY